jgi:hypothetical protein
VKTRIASRIAVIAVGAVLPLVLTAGPALAKINPDDGEVPGPSLGTGNTILLFVVIPLGVFLAIAALALLPSALSRPRYRPGKQWEHDPLWVGGPADGQALIVTDPNSSSAKGGASAEW